MDPELEHLFDTLKPVIDGVLSEMCIEHYEGITQEHQLTSRFAQAIEERTRRLAINNRKVEVCVQEFNDRGAGTLEAKVGADLYISITVIEEDRTVSINKGFLVQSKWDHTLKKDKAGLKRQINKMASRSDESYLWVYGASGVSVLHVDEDQPLGFDEKPQSVGNLLLEGVKCNAGDPRIGRDTNLPARQSLSLAMEQLGVPKAIAFTVDKNKTLGI